MIESKVLEEVHTVAATAFVIAGQAGMDVYSDAITRGVFEMVSASLKDVLPALLAECGTFAREVASARESARVYLGKRRLDAREVSVSDIVLAQAVTL